MRRRPRPLSSDDTSGRSPAAAAGLALGLGSVALLALHAVLRPSRVEVVGASMRPVLAAGDRLLVLRSRPRRGQLVVVPDPRAPGRVLVKRVTDVLPAGHLVVHGDNAAASTDSRHFGPVEVAAVAGRPVYRYHPPGRAGWLWTS